MNFIPLLTYQTLSGFIVFLAIIWILQEMTTVKILRYVILFIGKHSYHTSKNYIHFLFAVAMKFLHILLIFGELQVS